MKNFGERLLYLIKSSEIKSITNYAEKSNFSTVAISNVIHGKSKPSFDFIIACLDVFPDVDLNWLVSGERIAESLKLENKHLKERLQLSENKISRLAKYSSNRVSPQIPFPEFIPVYNV